MADPFIGQIVMFGGNFAPRGWALCDGQLLPIAQYTALFSILGTTYGGDGRTTFGLPDLRGRVAMHEGTGPGLSPRPLGQKGGAETVTLTTNQIPPLRVSTNTGTQTSPAGAYPAVANDGESNYSPVSNANSGGSAQSHNNLQPYQVVNYIIALTGIFPSRN